jgi:hypothetical protein
MSDPLVHPEPPLQGLRMVLLLLWGLLCGCMAVVALVGVATAAIGTASLAFDVSQWMELRLYGGLVWKQDQKLQFTVIGVVMALTGIGYVWLYKRNSVVGSLLCLAILLGMFLALAWATGRTEVISVNLVP